RILGGGDLWVSECVITYDGAPSYSVSIMEIGDGLVTHETQYFADPFEPPPGQGDAVARSELRARHEVRRRASSPGREKVRKWTAGAVGLVLAGALAG